MEAALLQEVQHRWEVYLEIEKEDEDDQKQASIVSK